MAKKKETTRNEGKYTLVELVDQCDLPFDLIMMRLSSHNLFDTYKHDVTVPIPLKRYTKTEFKEIIGE